MAVDRQGRPQGLQRPPPTPRYPGKEHLEAARWGGSAFSTRSGGSRASGRNPCGHSHRCRLGHQAKALEEKKAQAEAAEAAKKKADEEKLAKAKADNCTRARQAKAAFDSGKPITQSNAQGERIFLDEAGRAAESKRIDGIIAADCKR